jgi:hypothetical protein
VTLQANSPGAIQIPYSALNTRLRTLKTKITEIPPGRGFPWEFFDTNKSNRKTAGNSLPYHRKSKYFHHELKPLSLHYPGVQTWTGDM